mgnify:CR=1 FL=1
MQPYQLVKDNRTSFESTSPDKVLDGDIDEFLELLPTSLEEALSWVWNGKITDVKTIIGILWAEKLLKSED